MARRDASELHGHEHVREYIATDGEHGHDWRNGTEHAAAHDHRPAAPVSRASRRSSTAARATPTSSSPRRAARRRRPSWYVNLRARPGRRGAGARRPLPRPRAHRDARGAPGDVARDDLALARLRRLPASGPTGRSRSSCSSPSERVRPARAAAASSSRARPCAAASTSVASALPTPSTSAGPERLAERPGEQVADRQERERAHPVVGRDARERVRRHALGQRRVPPDPEQREPDAGGREQRDEQRRSGAPSANADRDRGPRERPQEPGAHRVQRPPAEAEQRAEHRPRAHRAAPAGRTRRCCRTRPRRSSARASSTGRTTAAARSRTPRPSPRSTRASGPRAYPSRISASSVWRSACSPRSRGRTRARKKAETRNVTASIANAQPAPRPSTSAVASAGPANSATVSSVLPAALASWISSSGTVCGTRPV